MMYLFRFAVTFVVLAFVAFFFWKTLLTTRYFQNRQRLRKILSYSALILLALVTTGFIFLLILE